MVQQTQTILTDDITGKPIPAGQGETITFAVNGVGYEIDLDDEGAKKFHETLEFYQKHARKIGRIPTGAAKAHRTSTEVDPAAVRAWARSNNIPVNPRGRIAGDVVAQFRAAGH